VFEEFASMSGLGVHVVVTCFGAESDLFQFLLTDLAGFVGLLRIGETHFAVVEDFADRRAFVSGYFHQVKAGFPRLFKSLEGWNHSQLLPCNTDQADGANADLLVPARAAVGRRLTVEKSNTWAP
jgi:hypothetical protein